MHEKGHKICAQKGMEKVQNMAKGCGQQISILSVFKSSYRHPPQLYKNLVFIARPGIPHFPLQQVV